MYYVRQKSIEKALLSFDFMKFNVIYYYIFGT